MWHLKSLFCHIKEVVNAKIPYIYVYVHLKYIRFHLGTTLTSGNLMRISVTSVQWAWLGLEWPPTYYVAKCHASLLSSSC